MGRRGDSWWVDQPATTQAQNQDYELAHPNIHFIYYLWKHVKKSVLQTQSCRISKRSPGEGPALIA